MTQSKTPTILITGATGNIGLELTKKLSAQGIPFRALVRSSKGAGLFEDYAHYRRGEASSIATGVQDSTGAPPRSFDQFARDYAPAFS